MSQEPLNLFGVDPALISYHDIVNLAFVPKLTGCGVGYVSQVGELPERYPAPLGKHHNSLGDTDPKLFR